MKGFNDNIKDSIRGIYNKTLKDKSCQESIEILDKISKDISGENYENFEAYNRIIEYELFDEEFYLKQCDSPIKTDSLLHYIYIGHLSDLNPCEKFDTKFYRDFNPNIKEDDNPLVYLVNHGIYEGIIKVNQDIWQPPAINKYEMDEKIADMNEYGLNTCDERNIPVIISLTSYPKRINEVQYTLYSLLDQEMKADKIVLWLSYEEFPNRESDLPETLIKFLKYGLTIKWCDSKRSYKKLIPSLTEYPDALIVTADDDLYYPRNWLKGLYEHHQKYPDDIVTHRSRKIGFENGEVKKYLDWTVLRDEEDASFLNFFTTGGGVLFPPHSLSDTIHQREIYDNVCPNGDDMWFWAMAVLNDTKIRVVSDSVWELTYVNPARDLLFKRDTLWSYNETHNDEQFKRLLDTFHDVYEKILKEDEEKQ